MLPTVLYDFFLPNKSEFRDSLRNGIENSNRIFHSMSNCETLLFLSCLLIVLITGISYFTWYNNTVKPWGYHYRKRHWVGWLIIALFTNLICTWIICKTTLVLPAPRASEFITWYIIANLCYTTIFYGILSFAWYNLFPTNAYRWWKIDTKK